MELLEIEAKLRQASRIGINQGWLYTCGGDSPGIADTLADASCCDRQPIGEIGKTPVDVMAARLAVIRCK